MPPPLVLALAILLVLAVPAIYLVLECRRHLGVPVAPAPPGVLRRTDILPQTTLGRWAGWLLLILVALAVWVAVGIDSGGVAPGSTLVKTLGLSLAVTAVATSVLALVSRLTLEDRAAVVVVAMVLGGIFTILAACELLG